VPAETKITDEEFPAAAFRDIGYQAVYAARNLQRRHAESNIGRKIITSLPNADGVRSAFAATIGGVRG
jgi:hypothetical protein